jgi:hypothetical protein
MGGANCFYLWKRKHEGEGRRLVAMEESKSRSQVYSLSIFKEKTKLYYFKGNW